MGITRVLTYSGSPVCTIDELTSNQEVMESLKSQIKREDSDNQVKISEDFTQLNFWHACGDMYLNYMIKEVPTQAMVFDIIYPVIGK